MAKRLIPSLNRVLVEKIIPPSKTSSGILLPEKTTKLNSGKVVAVGPGAPTRDGNIIPVSVKEGDTVLLPDYGGMEVKLGDKEYHLFEMMTTYWEHCMIDIALALPGWSELHGDLLDSLRKCLSLQDLIRFGCLHVLEVSFRYRTPSQRLFTMVNSSLCRRAWPRSSWEFRDATTSHPLTKKIVNLPPLTRFSSLFGSRLSEEKALVYLVSWQSPVLDGHKSFHKYDSNTMRDRYIHKAITSPVPDNDKCSARPPVVIAILKSDTDLYFCSPGKHDCWTRIEVNIHYADLIFYEGHNNGRIYLY
ncbi:hypothetical protein IFM89_028392 [Coptis chinensis]|uniref:Protein groES n=1 Tax=Coptis chinensis TaxID=261450 RepID=A0A835H9M2_9MAGN|nr:hypothetical protein IFM89_028392 [Coptis chinensis]